MGDLRVRGHTCRQPVLPLLTGAAPEPHIPTRLSAENLRTVLDNLDHSHVPARSHAVATCGQPLVTERYRIEPFGRGDWPVARDMLLRGYAFVPATVWDAAFARLTAVPPGTRDDAWGVLLHGPHGVCGVSLLISSLRGDSDPRRVNGSGWAMLPEARSRALWMCRTAMPDDGTVYTALTPMKSVQRMLLRIGFRPVSHQRVRVFAPRLATLAAQPRTMHVVTGRDAIRLARDDVVAEALDHHLRLGCIVCVAGNDDAWWPLVLVKRKRLGVVPVAEVIYAADQERLLQVLPALGAHLLRSGIPFIEFEAHEDLEVDLPCTRLFRRRFARGPYHRCGIDHLYSELVYVLR
jgi:hypothetical protein